MQKLTVRLDISDFERAQALADAAGVSVPMHIRQVYLERLKGLEIEAHIASTLEHYLAQSTAQLQANFRKQIELIDALDDRLTNSQAEFLNSLANAVQSEKVAPRTAKPLFAPPLNPTRRNEK